MRSTFLNDGPELPRGSGQYRVTLRIKRKETDYECYDQQ